GAWKHADGVPQGVHRPGRVRGLARWTRATRGRRVPRRTAVGSGGVALPAQGSRDGYAQWLTLDRPPGSLSMATCDVCGNDYDKAFTISGPMGAGTYDSFECAIHALAPTCSHCNCRII